MSRPSLNLPPRLSYSCCYSHLHVGICVRVCTHSESLFYLPADPEECSLAKPRPSSPNLGFLVCFFIYGFPGRFIRCWRLAFLSPGGLPRLLRGRRRRRRNPRLGTRCSPNARECPGVLGARAAHMSRGNISGETMDLAKFCFTFVAAA